MNKVELTKEDQVLTGRTEVAKAFGKLNFDALLYQNNIIGLETYISIKSKKMVNGRIVDDTKHIEGYEVRKTHIGSKVPTTYFIRTDALKDLPIKPTSASKVHDKGRVYNLVNAYTPMKIPRVKVYAWKEVVDYSSLPKEVHTNELQWTLFKAKMLYSRLKPHVYNRTVSESAFGKTKDLEWIRMLINNMNMLSDPSPAKLFYAACHSRHIIVNELPDDSSKTNFIKTCNAFMNLGDGTNSLDNPSRATAGTVETTDTENSSVTFTHNVPSYYKSLGNKCFEEIYPYNVVNRYYYNYYEGFLNPTFPDEMNFEELSKKYQDFFRGMVSSMGYYEDKWPSMVNKYPFVSLDKYTFNKKENRHKDHFIDFAKCLSHYATTQEQYIILLDTEYDSYKSYRKMLAKDVWKDKEFEDVKTSEEYV